MPSLPALRPRHLYLGNFDFEHELAHPGQTLGRSMRRLNAELAPAWISIAQDGDQIVFPEPPEAAFPERLVRAGLPNVTFQSLEIPEPSQQLVPWGWTPSLIDNQRKAAQPVPSADAVRIANSRQFSFDLELRWRVGLRGARSARSLTEVESAMMGILESNDEWVIKANFGMSGREQRRGSGGLSEQDRLWIARRLDEQSVVFVEPWVRCIQEVGLQFEIAAASDQIPGAIEFHGLAEMLPSSRGQYAGSIFAQSAELDEWRDSIDVAGRAVAEIQHLGYSGPVGIDAMKYADAVGNTLFRPLQDINARWTMGRLSLGWQEKFPAVQTGIWWHGSRADFQGGRPMQVAARRFPDVSNWRLVALTPEQLGGISTHHYSALLLSEG